MYHLQPLCLVIHGKMLYFFLIELLRQFFKTFENEEQMVFVSKEQYVLIDADQVRIALGKIFSESPIAVFCYKYGWEEANTPIIMFIIVNSIYGVVKKYTIEI